MTKSNKVLVTGYMNIYRSGYYHPKGKPDAYDRHPGDIYETRGAAKRDIDPMSHYIDTVPVIWHEEERPPVNPADSVAVPLKLTRAPRRAVDTHTPQHGPVSDYFDVVLEEANGA